jgi:L-aminopeptidase/D-esterase-like protein
MATEQIPLSESSQFAALGVAAAIVLARAIARGVYAAEAEETDRLPTWASIASGKN